ncbi:hypothetical protein CDD81_3831 [Ophiocordyceps australis]|uniref:Nodulin-like domain-containing protein n=1 Tax=Ophiocordyceps australis TaxID=1399860 RepID=A0A2C5XUE7_9HYPO|nr:hypothetical protein CDD81_3831 [Ophiocordyceps australis]
MSLAQHLTAQEGVDRNDRIPDGQLEALDSPRWRRMSFDVLAPPEVQSIFEQDPEPRAAAYTVSAAWRGFQVAFALVSCALASGIVFGFASIKPVFIARGVYYELCRPDGSSEPCEAISSLHSAPQGCRHACPDQDMRLNLLFIVASITTNVSSLFAGTVLDRHGRRACVTASALFLALGSAFMAASDPLIGANGYLVGNFFLSLGGSFLLLPSFQLSNAFPKYSGVIVALVTCAFDSSSAVFLFYRLAWSASGGAFTPTHFFVVYLVVPLAILIGEWTVMPAQPYHIIPELELKLDKARESDHDFHTSDDDISDDAELFRVRSNRADRRLTEVGQIESLTGNADERRERAQQEGDRLAASGVWGVLHGLSAREQMKTPWFILLLVFTALQMLRINYFIASIRSQYEYLLGSERDAVLVNKFFDAALPIGGVASTPFIAVVLNNMSVAVMLALLTFYVVLIGLLNCLPYMWAALATVVSFVVFRPFYYSAVSHTATTIFGFATFGRVYGTIIFVSGLFNISQYGLDALTNGPLSGNPTPVNIVIAAVSTVVGVVLTLFVLQKSKSYRQVSLKASSERGSLVSGSRVNGYGTLH